MTLLSYSSSVPVRGILGATAESLLAAAGDPERLRAVFYRSPIPMVMVDHRRRYVEVNRPARLMKRSSLAEMRRLTIDDLTPPDARPMLEEIWARMLDTGCAAGRGELPAVRGDDLPLRDPPGERGGSGSLEVVYWAMADALPGLHLLVFAPTDWCKDEVDEADASVDPQVEPLTPREREVLELAAEGFSGPSIAKRLGVSPTTIKTHSSNIYEKMGVSSRAAAVAMGLRFGLIA
jgi:DNA-binding CsgD family transcriptional regulator